MRTRFLNPLWLIFAVAALAMVGVAYFFMAWQPRSNDPEQPQGQRELFVYCAAGMRYAMEAIARDYEEEYGVRVNLNYGGSNTLLSQIKTNTTGDLYLAGDDSYIEMAREAGLAKEELPLARMRPVIARPKDQPDVNMIEDLKNTQFRIAMGNPAAAAIGKKTKKLLEKSGDWEAVEANVTANGVYKPTVNEVANDIKLGSVAAGIVWDSTVNQYPELVAIRVPELDLGEALVSIAVLTCSEQPTQALHFARFAAARDRGLLRFKEVGFDIVEGDKWEDRPKLTFYSGAVNRRAIEEAVRNFAEREGVEINTVYNGCGILTADMRSIRDSQMGAFPDAFMACDVYYLDTVQEMFEPGQQISSADIVIVVAEGNPLKIHSLEDLTREGVRVALGQPEQCTIGVLSRKLLQAHVDYDVLMKENVVTQTATSALLVPTITTNSADATLAYVTDTLAESDKIDTIRIDSRLARAVQPFSVSLSSDHPRLARRLFLAIAEAREQFEAAGFNWELPASTQPARESTTPASTSEARNNKRLPATDAGE